MNLTFQKSIEERVAHFQTFHRREDPCPFLGFFLGSEQLSLGYEACGGHFIYSASAFRGILWLEAGLGCLICANQNTGSIYCEPPPDYDPASVPEFSRENPWMRLLVERFDALNARSAGSRVIATGSEFQLDEGAARCFQRIRQRRVVARVALPAE